MLEATGRLEDVARGGGQAVPSRAEESKGRGREGVQNITDGMGTFVAVLFRVRHIFCLG